MKEELIPSNEIVIQNKIYTIRGLQVMLDSDLAILFGVETKVFNQAVKRNIVRFPESFRFQLTEVEFSNLRSQIVTSSWGGIRYLPFVFTEQGIPMLSAVLRSETAIATSIRIINAFVEMRKFIMNNALLFQRLESVEQKQLETDKRIDRIWDAFDSGTAKPKQGVFYDGQVYNAYQFVSDLIKTANNSLILIDNYVDDTVLTLFTKRQLNVQLIIYTKQISKQLQLDLVKHNEQYPVVEIPEFNQSHDRFLIVDGMDIYHFGASLKDLGKKWFAFSKFDQGAIEMLGRLGKMK